MAVRALEPSPSSEASSHIRLRESGSRAERRAIEYLRALGLTSTDRATELAHELYVSCTPEARTAEHLVALLQERYGEFLNDVFGPRARDVDALWLRAFIAAEPQAFLGDLAQARAAVTRFGDPWTGRTNAPTPFREQVLRRAGWPRWLRLGWVPAALTLIVSGLAVHALARDGLNAWELAWSCLFAFLSGLGSVGAWIALLGWRAPRAAREPVHDARPLPRSVVCVPIYEEDAERVFAAVAAMRESLAATAGGDAFELFVLSDSRRPVQAAEEERAFRRVAGAAGSIPVYYRRRTHNTRHKAGNLAEAFERWGARYTYAVVLDADSLITGETVVALTRRMHAQPRVGLLQAPLELHGAVTLFGRAQQFAASVCGPLFMRGLARWAGPHGNYYGHNAVLRVSAFLDCCALPTLTGEPPLGGNILSHDFVEAALLCRAGWEVRMAEDLGGSWEESPPTLEDHLARDRRWCQGNLQHLRVASAQGLLPMSRLHMLLGAACYLAAPAWLAFLALSLVLRLSTDASLPSTLASALCTLTGLFLLLPRVLGVANTWRDPRRRAAHGGGLCLSVSAIVELGAATLITPLLMWHHTRIVATVLLGKHAPWTTQQRRARGTLSEIARAELPVSLCGALVALALHAYVPLALLWLAPIWLPWLCAFPLACTVDSARCGQALARAGLLCVPTEREPHELIARVAELRALTRSDDSARFRDLVLDPLLAAAHIAELERTQPTLTTQAAQLEPLRRRALRIGPAALSREERSLLAADLESMRWLHCQAWRHWPVETWNLAREQPQLPPSHE